MLSCDIFNGRYEVFRVTHDRTLFSGERFNWQYNRIEDDKYVCHIMTLCLVQVQ